MEGTIWLAVHMAASSRQLNSISLDELQAVLREIMIRDSKHGSGSYNLFALE